MLMFVFLAGLMLSAGIVAFAHKKVDFAKVLILGCGGYFAAYAFVSGMLFLLEMFMVVRCAVITAIVLLVIFLIQLAVKRFEVPMIRYRWKEYLPLAIILILCAFISRGNITGYHGTGQDEGLYQIRAMYYYMDQTDTDVFFREYELITESKYEAELYGEEIRDLLGYHPDYDFHEQYGTIKGVLHGLGVLPAIMALWGRLFGLEYMNHVMMTCYLISIGNVWLICRNIKEEKKLFANIAALIFAVSPIVVWCGTNTLTEIVLTMFVTGWFVILTASSEEGVQLLALLPLGGLCVLHILSSALMPMIVLIYWGSFFIRGKKSFLMTIMFALAQYALGFSMMKLKFSNYTDGNYLRIYYGTDYVLNKDNILTIVWTVTLICMFLSLVFMIRGRRGLLRRLVKRIGSSERGYTGCRIFMIVSMAAMLIAIIAEFVERADKSYCYPLMTVLGFVYMLGFVIFPAALAVMVIKGGEFLSDRRFFALSLALTYVVWLYCVFVMPEVSVYYYYVRYLAPFIFLPIVIAGLYSWVLPKKAQIAAAGIIASLMLFQSRALYKGQDLTYCSYRTLMDITSCIGENDAVLINEQGYRCQRIFAFPIKALSGAAVYFVRASEIQKQMDRLDKDFDKVFLLSIDTGGLVGKHEGWTPMLHVYAEGGSLESLNDTFPPYPKDWEKLKTPIVMMIKE